MSTPKRNSGTKDVVIWNTEETKSAEITSEGRVKVDAKVTVDQTTISGTKVNIEQLTKNQSLSTSSYTTIYTYSGTGSSCGFFLRFNNSDISIKWTIDGHDLIDEYAIADMPESENAPIIFRQGNGSNTCVYVQLESPVAYGTSISILAKANHNNRKLVNGHITLCKES